MDKEHFYQILDALKKEFDSINVVPSLLYSWFEKTGYLDKNEIHLIENAGIPTERINVFLNILKSKQHEVLSEIQTMARYYKWHNILEFLGINFGVPNAPKEPYQVGEIKRNLKCYLEEDVEFVYKYWDKMGAGRLDGWENFYDSNITFTREDRTPISNINSFKDLFEGKKFKRIVISAHAGYGKSTFVHEMVRQWVNDKEWTKRFSLVFLFRLGEIRTRSNCNVDKPLTMTGLLNICLLEANVQAFIEYFEKDLYSNILFVFDGFDELQKELISDEVYNLIVGRSKHKPYVVVTSRPERLESLKGKGCNTYVELDGFTDNGVIDHMKKFGVAAELYFDLRDIIKIPLFAVLIGMLLQEKNGSYFNNLCSLIDNTVKYLLNRYCSNNPAFSKVDEEELLCVLGQAAQSQFDIMELRLKHWASDTLNKYFYDKWSASIISMRDSTSSEDGNKVRSACIIHMPDFTTSHNSTLLAAAISANLILPSSTKRKLSFHHRIFQEYFAAYFWSKKHVLEINCIKGKKAEANSESLGFEFALSCQTTSSFSMFLCFFNEMRGTEKTYKTQLWKEVQSCSHIILPLFNDYNDNKLNDIKPQSMSIDFRAVSYGLASCALKKISVRDFITFYHLKLDEGISRYGNILSRVPQLELRACTINIFSDFFKIYNVESLKLTSCRFNNTFSVQLQGSKRLKVLAIKSPKGNITNFLQQTLKTCTNLKALILEDVKSDWINSIEKRKISNAEIVFGNVQRTADNLEDAKRILTVEFPSSSISTITSFSCKFV